MALFDILQKNVVDPIFGNSDAQRAAAQAALDKALAEYTKIQTPNLQEVNLSQLGALPEQEASSILQNPPPISYDQIDPTLYQALTQKESNLNNISLDPKYQAAQDEALASLQDIVANKGLTAQDRANLQNIQSQVNTQDRGRREAILQGMNARGMGGSGLELLSQLQSAQDATSRQSQADLDVGAQAQARQLNAILQSGQLGGNIQQQQFGQKSDIARANDIINQFNTQNANQAAQYNAGVQNQFAAQNAANKYNAAVGNRQSAQDVGKFNIQNQNTVNAANTQARQNTALANNTTRNQQIMYNAGLPQQNFQNQMSRASGIAGQYGNQSAAQQANAAAKDAQISNYINAAIKGASLATQKKKNNED